MFYVPQKWFWRGDGPAQYVGKLVNMNGDPYVMRHINGQDYYVPLAKVQEITGFWNCAPSDWREWIVANNIRSGDDLFREAGRHNNVPNEIIEAIIEVANSTEIKIPTLWQKIWQKTHNRCEQWIEIFEKRLQEKLNEMGHKNGLKIASNGGISNPLEKVVFFVPGSFPLFDPDQDHAAMKITFKDGTIFYIDNKTISQVINPIHGPSHFANYVPPSWEQYPRKRK